MRVIWSNPALAGLRKSNAWRRQDQAFSVAIRTMAAIRYRACFLGDLSPGGRPRRRGERVSVVTDPAYLIRYRIAGDVVQVIRAHHERGNRHVEP